MVQGRFQPHADLCQISIRKELQAKTVSPYLIQRLCGRHRQGVPPLRKRWPTIQAESSPVSGDERRPVKAAPVRYPISRDSLIKHVDGYPKTLDLDGQTMGKFSGNEHHAPPYLRVTGMTECMTPQTQLQSALPMKLVAIFVWMGKSCWPSCALA